MSKVVRSRAPTKPPSIPSPRNAIVAHLRMLARRSHREAKVTELGYLGVLGDMLLTFAELVEQTRDETLWLYTLASVAQRRAERRTLASLPHEST